MNIFEASQVVKRYGDYTALDRVSIAVKESEIYGLLGPNGAGKTSLIRIINQITAPDEGEIYFKGERFTAGLNASFGYLPEERGLYKKMLVGEHALYLAQLRGMKKHDAARELKLWFEKFEITQWWNKRVEELSKGMQQKVQFVVTVLHRPTLLILDEPFSGFDPINANLIKNEIIRLKKEGTTIILSTHNMGSVEELCDSIALINRSKKILEGSVREIRKQHSTRTYEIEFSGHMIALTNSIWTSCELLNHRQEAEHHVATIKLLGDTTINSLLPQLLPWVNINGLKEVIPTMNDIFIRSVSENDPLEEKSSRSAITE